jgi:hypothetical protein
VIKNRLRLAALISIFSFLSFAQGAAVSPYEAMVEKIKAGDAEIDFRQLWLSYVAFQVRHTLKNMDPQKQAMNQVLRDKDYKKALEEAESVLHEEFVNVDARSAESFIYREEGQSEKADRQNWILAWDMSATLRRRPLFSSFWDCPAGKPTRLLDHAG